MYDNFLFTKNRKAIHFLWKLTKQIAIALNTGMIEHTKATARHDINVFRR